MQTTNHEGATRLCTDQPYLLIIAAAAAQLAPTSRSCRISDRLFWLGGNQISFLMQLMQVYLCCWCCQVREITEVSLYVWMGMVPPRQLYRPVAWWSSLFRPKRDKANADVYERLWPAYGVFFLDRRHWSIIFVCWISTSDSKRWKREWWQYLKTLHIHW